MEQHLGAGHVAARVGIGVVTAEILHVAEDVPLPVLRHCLPEIGPHPKIRDGGRRAIETLDWKPLHHDHAAAIDQFAAHVGKHVRESPEREIFPRDRLDRDAMSPYRGHRIA